MPKHCVVVGMGFGDESKGATTDYLCREYNFTTVVRFSGGCQTAHHVLTDDGAVHRFSQFGSGTFRGCNTYLSRYAIVDPIRLAVEAEKLASMGVPEPLDMMFVDGDCLITTPYHAAANKVAERRRGTKNHGSCGVGVGETRRVADKMWGSNSGPLRVKTIQSPSDLRKSLEAIENFYRTEDTLSDELINQLTPIDELIELYNDFFKSVHVTDRQFLTALLNKENCLFEGTQGVLLDEYRGFYPHNTWTQTTDVKAQSLLRWAGLESAYVLGCTRVYATRHGAGPFPTESASITERYKEEHNGTGIYQGAWRAGHFDGLLFKYATQCLTRLDGISLSHLDTFDWTAEICTEYKVDGFSVSAVVPQPNVLDLPNQKTITDGLFKATPIYRHWENYPQHVIGDLAGKSVVITSNGSSAFDRKGEIPQLESIRRA